MLKSCLQWNAEFKIQRVVYVVAAMIATATAAFHAHTFWWSESLTICDVTLMADEGLLSLNLPLTRIAANETPRSGFLLYSRGPKTWVAGKAGHTPLRSWMAMVIRDEVNVRYKAMVADFGYWLGGWQSDSRPGPFIVLFVPIWFVGLSLFGTYLAFHYKLVRFKVRTLLFAITAAAIACTLLMLRDKS